MDGGRVIYSSDTGSDWSLFAGSLPFDSAKSWCRKKKESNTVERKTTVWNGFQHCECAFGLFRREKIPIFTFCQFKIYTHAQTANGINYDLEHLCNTDRTIIMTMASFHRSAPVKAAATVMHGDVGNGPFQRHKYFMYKAYFVLLIKTWLHAFIYAFNERE